MERLQHLSRMSYRDTGPIMFTKVGIIDLHTATHERLDLLLSHVATVPDDLCHKPISGFGHASIWKQLVHVTCEEGWVHGLQNKTFPGWHEEDCPTVADLQAAKDRIREATRAYVSDTRRSNSTRPFDSAPWIGVANSGVLRLSCCT